MIEAGGSDVWRFKEQYCRNWEARKKMLHDFDVSLEEREELIPGKRVISYALDEKYIENEMAVFKVTDSVQQKIFYPIFSKEKMMEIVEFTGMEIPAIRSIYVHRDVESRPKVYEEAIERENTVYDNLQFRKMILYIRSLMILHIDKPRPMEGAMKSIFEKMTLHPNWRVRASEIKSINTALCSHLRKDVNIRNENYSNLQEYIAYVKTNSDGKILKETDFSGLKRILREKYFDEQIYF